ncbi:hypothetical protein C7377_1039 [Balneicella halophila]|uniref:Uncharacterized protein n=1 Tax=Balneicella halophila TaxID=1537566 RepID=A0A7L4UPJ7_BALHA|nr:hypothetical protein [Balneicella halophila]PVX50726.1 hypothetical protein C7377_1039 [Balneicella halophila]
MKPLNIISIILLISLSISCGTSRLTPQDKSNIFYADKATVTGAIVSVLHAQNYTIDMVDNLSGIINASKSEKVSVGSQILSGLANTESVTNEDIHKVYFIVEPVNKTQTEVKLTVKSGYVDEDWSNEGSSQKKYRESVSENNASYQKWFSQIALEVQKRLEKQSEMVNE